MRYRISHVTEFTYAQAVSASRQLLHLSPRAHGGQRVLRTEVRTTPNANHRHERKDYFGNTVIDLTLFTQHKRLSINSLSEVDIADAQDILLDLSPDWHEVRDQLNDPMTTDAWDASRFAFPSQWIDLTDVLPFAQSIFTPGKPLLRGAMQLTETIYADFRYQGGVTDVYTPVGTVLNNRRGVCQDFAHLAIAALRAMGLAARYVSGYLLTHAKPGRPKLVGADASHAWISVWCPEFGWIDFDPTNNMRPGNEHIVIGWGRDYGDVSPVKGIIRGGGKQRLKVAVTVSPDP